VSGLRRRGLLGYTVALMGRLVMSLMFLKKNYIWDEFFLLCRTIFEVFIGSLLLMNFGLGSFVF
jgi:hypothetical protein